MYAGCTFMNPNRLLRQLVIFVYSGAGVLALAAPRLPLEDFVHDLDVSQLQLSPDGSHESFVHYYKGIPTLCCEPVGTTDAIQFDLGMIHALNKGTSRAVGNYGWISDDRLMLTTTAWDSWYGTLAANHDNTMVHSISGLETLSASRGQPLNINESDFLWAYQWIHHFDDPERNVLMLDLHNATGDSRRFPDVVRVNTLTGATTTVAKNPGDVLSWGVDHDGHVRIGMVGSKHEAIYRENENTPWRKLELPDNLTGSQVLVFDHDDQHVFVTAESPEHRVALAWLELGDKPASKLVLSDPEYDVIPEAGAMIPTFDRIPLARPVYSAKKNALVGITYLREGPRVQWFDKGFATFQQKIDQKMPNTVNLYVDHSRDEKRALFLCYSDRDPGTYCLVDLEKKSVVSLGSRMPQIKPDEMAQMFPIHYAARDGLNIHGYLTVPVGYKPKQLPLIVMPHGGPRVRDIWGFDPMVQFLANRGYAVLQMNYRGSPGYGREFFEKGMKQFGAAIQDDIEDAARWAVAKGIADPERLAILGSDYGGYSVMFALGHNPGLYKCGVSIAGVTDWPGIYQKMNDDVYKFAQQTWRENLGDPMTDEAMLKSISPVNFSDRITAPLLLIQGRQDYAVPFEQANAMVSAMETAGHRPESLFLEDDGHGLTAVRARREAYKAIESFLEKNLGAGLPPRDPENAAPAAHY
jgi:dipeptidyl aminopeptidase/acylaminoacyl peptidase